MTVATGTKNTQAHGIRLVGAGEMLSQVAERLYI